MKSRGVVAALVIFGCILQVFCGAAHNVAASASLFLLGTAVAGFGLWKWSDLRGSSKWILISLLIPYYGPPIGLLVAPGLPTAPPEPDPTPLMVRLGIVIGNVGILIAFVTAELGIAILVFGLAVCMASLKPGPEHRRWHIAVMTVGVLIAAGFLWIRPWMGQGTLW